MQEEAASWDSTMGMTHKTIGCSALEAHSTLTWAAAIAMVAVYSQVAGIIIIGQTYLLGTMASSSRQKVEANTLLLAHSMTQQTGTAMAQSTSQGVTQAQALTYASKA